MAIKYKQRLWLKSRGDRDEGDVVMDEYGNQCVYMHKAYKGDQLVIIPPENDIRIALIDGRVSCGDYNWGVVNTLSTDNTELQEPRL